MERGMNTPHSYHSALNLQSALPVWNGVLEKIYTSPGQDYWGKQGAGRFQNGINSLEEVECVAGMGLRGDRYFGFKPDYKGQVTFLDSEVVEEVRILFKLPMLPASIFRRNLIVRGINLSEWMGKRFLFQGIEFEGSQQCKPCHWMNRVIADGAQEFLRANFRGGLRAKICSSGILRVAPGQSEIANPNVNPEDSP